MNKAESNVACVSDVPPKTAWKAQLSCAFEKGARRTLVRRTHSGPLSIQRPFYPDGKTAHVYILHPPGGVVGGDKMQIDIDCASGAGALLTTPGATRFYRSAGATASLVQTLRVAGSLEWFPQETIFFDGSKVALRTHIHLECDSSLAWWDINCFGRSLHTEAFKTGEVLNTLDLQLEGSLILKERLRVDRAFPQSMSCGLRGHSVSGLLILTPLHSESLDYARKILHDSPQFSSTCFDSMLLVRYLGDCSEQAKTGFTRVWSTLRPALNQSVPVLPRIWAT